MPVEITTVRDKPFREELAWAAGLFDGEGHVGCEGRGPYRSMRIQMTQTDPEVLERFVRAVGLGKVFGPYRNHKTDSYKSVWRISLANFEKAQAIIGMLWTFLSTPKRAQCRNAVLTWRQFPAHRYQREGA